MRIRLYGRLGDAIGREMDLDAPDGSTVGEIRQLLMASHPAVTDALARSRACAGDRLVRDHERPGSDILEFLPPVSGG